ncbi:MAG TPA: sulfotransferase domain-containing protein [Actinophytocola sp.]|nr:sulfotransferase domain-containing protein [Actinophytocola sp.]
MSEKDMLAELARRYQRNAELLGAGDIVVATVPGSGSSLFSTLILELGFAHLDQYFNMLQEDRTVQTDETFRTIRSRMSGYAEVDSGAKQAEDERARFFRCHIQPDLFDLNALHGAVLLIRDPRDAAHSLYQFLGKMAGRLPGSPPTPSFPDFLDAPGHNGVPPVQAWTDLYSAWLEAKPKLRHFAVVHFADLKQRPVEAVTDMLAQLELPVAPERVERAVERSSFEKMRAHEDKVAATLSEADAPDLRMMRRGKVNEWQEWFTPDLARRFADDELIKVAGQFGYHLAEAAR